MEILHDQRPRKRPSWRNNDEYRIDFGGFGRTHTSLEIFLLGKTSTYACGTTHTFLFSSLLVILHWGVAFCLFRIECPAYNFSVILSIVAENKLHQGILFECTGRNSSRRCGRWAGSSSIRQMGALACWLLGGGWARRCVSNKSNTNAGARMGGMDGWMDDDVWSLLFVVDAVV